MIDWGRPFRASYHPARAYLLNRAVLGLLAFDLWVDMLEHAGRYSAGGFNVAHFAFIDRLFPAPSAAFYGGILVLSGFVAGTQALSRAFRAGKLLLAGLYTLGWMISLHDSYQHHYLLSWILLWLAFVPDVRARDVIAADAPLVRGVGVPLMAFTCAIVYGFTGISKSEADWRSGAVLSRLSHSKPPGDAHPGVLDPLRNLLLSLGLDSATAWMCIALSVIALQWCVSAGYLASIERDQRPSFLRKSLPLLGLFGAWSFHAFAELGDMFDIGWFSYYMLAVSFALLAPASWVSGSIAQFVEPRFLVERAWLTRLLNARWFAGGMLVLACAAVLFVSWAVDIPGALWATQAFALLLLGWVVFCKLRGGVARAVGPALAGLVAAACFWASLTQTSARFDYYRRAAGEYRRMGQLETALWLYMKADAYAPPGSGRRSQIRELQRELREHKDPKAP